MARAQFIPGKLDVLRGVESGERAAAQKAGIQQRDVQLGQGQQRINLAAKEQVFQQEQELAQAAQKAKALQIDQTESMYRLAVKNKRFDKADELLGTLGELSGIKMRGNHEEIANVLEERDKAQEAGDQKGVAASTRFLLDTYGITPAEAAATIGRTSVVRKEERAEAITEEKRAFELGQTRQEEERTRKTKALIDILDTLDVDDDTKQVLLGTVQGLITPSAGQQILKEDDGRTVQSGLEGTFKGNEGKRVTAVFDKAGKRIEERVEHVAQRAAGFVSKNLPTGQEIGRAHV